MFFRKTKNIHLQELLKGSSIAFLLKIIGLFAGYVYILIISRYYGPVAVGVLSLSITLLNITSILGRLGFDTALIKFVAQYNTMDKRDYLKEVYIKALKLIIPFSFLLTTVIYFNVSIIAEKVFHKSYLVKYFKIASTGIVPLVLLHLNKQSLRGLKRITEFSIFDRGANFILSITALIIIIIFFRKDIKDPVIAYVIGIAGAAILSEFLWLNRSGIAMLSSSTKSEFTIKYQELLKVSLSMLLISSMQFIMQWTDTVMIGIFKTEREVGIYNVAMRVSTITSLTLFAINSIAAPKFAELYARRDLDSLKETVQHSTKLIFWTSLPVLLVFIFLPSYVLKIFGKEFHEGALVLTILAIGQFINSISGSVGYFLNMTGKEKVFQNILLTATIINIGLNYIFIQIWGIVGTAIATMLCTVFSNISSVIYIKRDTGILTLYFPGIRLKN